jgi:glycosyltransferase involved in cell wall biosynthesis
VVDYRASVADLAAHLRTLLNDATLRRTMGEAGRRRVIELYDYRSVARRFVEIVQSKLNLR